MLNENIDLSKRAFTFRAVSAGFMGAMGLLGKFDLAKAQTSLNERDLNELTGLINKTKSLCIKIENIYRTNPKVDPVAELNLFSDLCRQLGELARKHNDRNLAGFIYEGSIADKTFKKYEALLSNKNDNPEYQEEIIVKILEEVSGPLSVQGDNKNLMAMKLYRGFICGYYGYCGLAY